MADFAVGISTAVEALVTKVNTAMEEEAEQWQTVQRDLVFITEEFQTMQAFLNSADGERVRTNVTRTWVRQVRSLSYEFEDCIDFILHLDTSKRSWWLRLLPSCSCGQEGVVALPVDEAVAQIQQLRARVEDVSQRNIRYRIFSDSDSQSSLTQQSFLMAGSAPGFDILVEARDTAARCKGAVDLTKLLTEKSDDLRVISVWGTGDDLWTLPIIRNTYDDPTTYENYGFRAWVKMTNPINPHEFIRSLVFQFYANSRPEQGASIGALSWLRLKKQRDALSWTETSTGDLLREFVRQVNTHRYLIVLEDLSTVVQWDAIRPFLRDRNNGSRIVVSTRHHEIASLCTGQPHRVSELHRISANQSICIFFKVGFARAAEGVIGGDPPTWEYVEHWLKKNRLVGRDSEVEKLFNLIKHRPYTNKPHVVSVCGIPGSGRTALVTNVYYRCFKETLFDRQTTVNMPEPYNLMGFCRCLLSGLNSFQTKDPIKLCKKLLHRHRCLVVIDELQSKEDWDSIKDSNLISAESESCIVVITAEESVAVHCPEADHLVCSIKYLQASAAFDLFKQAFQKQADRNNRNSSGKQEYRSSFVKRILSHILDVNGPEEQAFQKQAYPNNRNSFGKQEYRSSFVERIFDVHGPEEQAFQNKGNSFEEQAFQNDGNSFEEQALQNEGNSFEEQALQNNGNSSEEQVSQNNGKSFEEQALHKNGSSIEEEALQNNGSFKEQVFQNNGKSFQEQACQNSGNSFREQAFQNNGNSLEEAFRFVLAMNNQEEHAFQNNGSWFEEYAFPNSRSWLEEQEFQNSENSIEEEVFQNSEDLFEEQSSENSENSFEEWKFQNRRRLLEEVEFQNDKNLPEEHTFPNIEVSMSRDNPNVKAILSRSGGIPQVIVALGRYFANRQISNIGIRELQCQRLLANFMQELQTSQEFSCLRGLFAWVRSYFSSCPPSLMRSMLYLLLFPRGKIFRRRRLVRRWVAEGYAKGTESNSLEEEAGDLFNKLASQSVMQQATLKNMDACYEVNGFFHEYMISRPLEERIFFPLEVSILEAEGYSRLTREGVGQHLAIWSSWDRNKIEFDSLDLLRLRSFTVFGRWESFFISDKMKVLRVLDLEDARDVTNDDVDKIGKVLLRLKFLSLRGNRQISVLPDSLGGLKQLQTLDVRKTSVPMLPAIITKLQKLQYIWAGTVTLVETTSTPSLSTTLMSRLRAATLASRFRSPKSRTRCNWLPGSRKDGVDVPRGIGQMTALHTLGYVSVAGGRAILEDLKNLTQLRRLGVSGINRGNCPQFWSAISGHGHLESLSVWLDNGDYQSCLDDISSPPENLLSLKLCGHVIYKLPIRIEGFKKLSKLNLQMAMLLSDEIDIIGRLPELKSLCLCFREFQDGALQFRSGFNNLAVLEIACSSRLQAVTFVSGVMRRLEWLKFRCCNESSFRVSGLTELSDLKEVSLSGSYEEELKEQLQTQLKEHPKEIKPVLGAEPCSP